MTIRELYPNVYPTLLLDFANSKQLDPRITFTRASSAVYYDGESVIKAEENLLPQSQNFNGWGRSAVSVATANELAPDSTVTADTVTGDGTTTNHFVWQGFNTITTFPYVYSVFAKAGTNNFMQIYYHSSTTVYANFDLSTGTIGTVGAGCTASMDPSANGFYRCSIYRSSGFSGQIRFHLITSNTAARAETNTLTTSIILWGAQAEQREVLTAYTPTTTTAITRYQPVQQPSSNNQPRFDHDPVTGDSLGLLIEEQRTNLLVESEGFSEAVWSKLNISLSDYKIHSPGGTLVASKIVENTAASSAHLLATSVNSTLLTWCMSMYVKAAERTSVTIVSYNNFTGLPGATVVFNLATVQTTVSTTAGATASAQIQAVGNDWYRCSVITTAPSAGTTITSGIYLADGAGNIVYTGDGYSGVWVWGAQLEAGAFPTSYIFTEGSQVTRSAEVASISSSNFSSWFNTTEGTIYAESSRFVAGVNNGQHVVCAAGVDDTNTNELIQLGTETNTTNFQFLVNDGGTAQCDLGDVGTTALTKYMGAYKQNDFAYTQNADTPQTDTSGTIPTVNQFNLGSRPSFGGEGFLNGHINKIAYYAVRLTNTQLQSLTK